MHHVQNTTEPSELWCIAKRNSDMPSESVLLLFTALRKIRNNRERRIATSLDEERESEPAERAGVTNTGAITEGWL